MLQIQSQQNLALILPYFFSIVLNIYIFSSFKVLSERADTNLQKSDINVSSHLHRWACLRLFFFFHLCSDGRSARTHAGTRVGVCVCVCAQLRGSRLHMANLMCERVFLEFPCCHQWRLIKHCSPPLSLKLIQKISQLQTVISCWKVEELNSESMTFSTANLLLQLLEKLVRNHHHRLGGKREHILLVINVYPWPISGSSHHKCFVYCSYRGKIRKSEEQ